MPEKIPIQGDTSCMLLSSCGHDGQTDMYCCRLLLMILQIQYSIQIFVEVFASCGFVLTSAAWRWAWQSSSFHNAHLLTLAQKINSSPFHLQILKWPDGPHEWLMSHTDQKKLFPDFLKFKLNKRGVSFLRECIYRWHHCFSPYGLALIWPW